VTFEVSSQLAEWRQHTAVKPWVTRTPTCKGYGVNGLCHGVTHG